MELLIALFFISLLWIPLALFRAAVLFPYAARAGGWKRAFWAYKFSVAFAVLLLVYGVGHLTGFSWQRMRYVSEEELIRNAIQLAYPRVYDDLAALRVDYPGFEPEVRYWRTWYTSNDDDLRSRLLGFAHYQVKLPDVVVSLQLDGKARYTFYCEVEGCEVTPPADPAFGVIGTVHRVAQTPRGLADFQIDWGFRPGEEVLQNSFCFAIYGTARPSAPLTITSTGSAPLVFLPRYGFHLMEVQLPPLAPENSANRATYKQVRITLQQFLEWRSCRGAPRDEWPDIAARWQYSRD